MPKQVISSSTNATPPLKVEAGDEYLWNDFIDALQSGRSPEPSLWVDRFGPLQAGRIDRMLVVGQLG